MGYDPSVNLEYQFEFASKRIDFIRDFLFLQLSKAEIGEYDPADLVDEAKSLWTAMITV